MRTEIRNLGLMILAFAAVVGIGMAQETTPATTKERHVRDIEAEQTDKVLSESPLCQETRAKGSTSPTCQDGGHGNAGTGYGKPDEEER